LRHQAADERASAQEAVERGGNHEGQARGGMSSISALRGPRQV
jgi:hypothetical protein